MKLLRIAIPLLFIIGFSACSESPGPLATGNSRIKVHCTGFSLSDLVVYVIDTASNQRVGAYKTLSCLFSGEVYFDVPVPPSQYKVYINNQMHQQVTIGGAGIEVTVNYDKYNIPYGGTI